MKALRLYGPGDLRLGEEPAPRAGDGASLVRVTAVGLCGSDLHWFIEGSIGDARLERPLVLGHEFAGVVQGGPLDGQRVAADPAISCGHCARCREGNPNLCPTVRFAGHGSQDGGLREYLDWPTRLLHPLPDVLGDVAGAMLEPLGIAVHSYDLGHARVGAEVAVVGCGPIGLLLVQVARAAGAARIVAVDPLDHRLAAAERYGATTVLDPEAARRYEPADPAGDADVAFEAAGTDDAVVAAMHLVRPGGRVVLAGIPDDDLTTFPASLARRKGLTISLVRRMGDTYPRAIALVRQGLVDVDSVVSHQLPMDRAVEAFAVAARRQGLKVVVRPT